MTKSGDENVNIADGLSVGQMSVRNRWVVSISGSTEEKGARLTGRDHVHKKSSSHYDLVEPVHSGFCNFQVRVIVPFEGVPISYHQDDSGCCPKHAS